MSKIRGHNTKPELILRKSLWDCGFRYRLKSKLPGKPDVVFPGSRTVVFVDGCFWHGCPEHSVRPATNRKFWDKKLSRNRERDGEVNAKLKMLGWSVLRFWEHEINSDVERVVSAIAEQLTD